MPSYIIHTKLDFIAHKGNKNSGRFRRGSGKRPHQHDGVYVALTSEASKKLRGVQKARHVENNLMTTASVGIGVLSNFLVGPGLSGVPVIASTLAREANTSRLRDKGYNIIMKDLGIKNNIYGQITVRNLVPDSLKLKTLKGTKEESEFWKSYAKELKKEEKKNVKKKQK